MTNDTDTNAAERMGNWIAHNGTPTACDLWNAHHDAVTAERDELRAELAEERDESMWRFWSEKARQVAEERNALRADKAALEDALADAAKERDRLRDTGGVAAIAAERRRQIEREGWTSAHDDTHDQAQMAAAAACYALSAAGRTSSVHPPLSWPWDVSWWKPKNPRFDLVRAGALIAAEIDRLDRAALTPEADT